MNKQEDLFFDQSYPQQERLLFHYHKFHVPVQTVRLNQQRTELENINGADSL